MAVLDGSNDCGIRFICDNYVNDADITLSEGTSNAQFPLKNLNNPLLGKYARIESNDAKIVFDLKQITSIDSFVVLGNPHHTFGMSNVSFKTAPSTDFSTATSYNIPLNAEQNMGYVFLETPVSHRYVEFTFVGTGSYTEIGHILIGSHIYLPQNNLSIGSFAYGYTDLSTISKNQYNQRFVDKRNLVKTLSGTLEACTKEEMDQIDTMYISKGRHEPIFMVTDIGGNSLINAEYKLSSYGYFESQPSWSAVGGFLYSTSITLESAE